MKQILLFASIFLAFGFSYQARDTYKPVIMKRSDMEKAIELQGPRELNNPGKIYFKDDHVLIGEKYKGIHVIDNSDSLNPENIAFIRIPGCIDMAMRRGVLYTDNAVDLISLQLKDDLSGVEVTSRTRNVFPEFIPPDRSNIPWDYQKENRPGNTIIVEWKK
jgi:hypothetical protein